MIGGGETLVDRIVIFSSLDPPRPRSLELLLFRILNWPTVEDNLPQEALLDDGYLFIYLSANLHLTYIVKVTATVNPQRPQ